MRDETSKPRRYAVRHDAPRQTSHDDDAHAVGLTEIVENLASATLADGEYGPAIFTSTSTNPGRGEHRTHVVERHSHPRRSARKSKALRKEL